MPGKRTLTFKPGAFLRRIGGERTSREYGNKQSIFSQGDAVDAMFYVEAGNVKQTVLSKRGKRAVIAIYRKGDFFGEGCLGPPSRQTSTAVAVHISTVARVEKATIIRIVHDDPAFARLLIGQLLSRIARMEEDFLDQLFNSSEKRLARTLLLLGVLSATEGEHALSMFEAYPVDLVLLDHAMLDADGELVVHKIKRCKQNVPIIAVSAEPIPEETLSCADCVVTNEQDPLQLLQTIGQLLVPPTGCDTRILPF